MAAAAALDASVRRAAPGQESKRFRESSVVGHQSPVLGWLDRTHDRGLMTSD